jgi:hypothetical protein
MNNIIKNRIEQLISTKFLKTESEIQALTLSLEAINQDFKKNHGANKIHDKQIETLQIHILNKIRNTFTSGELYLSYFNNQNDNLPFGKLNTFKIMNVVNQLENLNSAEANRFVNNKKSNFQHKRVHKNKTQNKSNKQANIVYK